MNTQRVKSGAELVEFIKNEQVMRNTFACDVMVQADGTSTVKKIAYDGIGLVVENESLDPDQFVSANSVFVAAVLD